MSAKKITDAERERRFWSRVNKTEGCWLWTGCVNKATGYGEISISNRTTGTHVYSYRINCGPTNGAHVLHTCDVKRCVKPDHLRLGTPLDNTRDMTTKGRHARSGRPGAPGLSPEAVADVVATVRGNPGVRGVKAVMARKYHVTASCITQVLNRHDTGASSAGAGSPAPVDPPA